MFPVVEKVNLSCSEALFMDLISPHSRDNEKYIGSRLASIGDELNKNATSKRSQVKDARKQTLLIITRLVCWMHTYFVRFH